MLRGFIYVAAIAALLWLTDAPVFGQGCYGGWQNGYSYQNGYSRGYSFQNGYGGPYGFAPRSYDYDRPRVRILIEVGRRRGGAGGFYNGGYSRPFAPTAEVRVCDFGSESAGGGNGYQNGYQNGYSNGYSRSSYSAPPPRAPVYGGYGNGNGYAAPAPRIPRVSESRY